MGKLTDDMMRLRGEIEGARRERGALVKGLQKEAVELKGEVAKLREGFRREQGKRAKETREDLSVFVRDLKKDVHEMRREFAADLVGARQAWAGGKVAAEAVYPAPPAPADQSRKAAPKGKAKS